MITATNELLGIASNMKRNSFAVSKANLCFRGLMTGNMSDCGKYNTCEECWCGVADHLVGLVDLINEQHIDALNERIVDCINLVQEVDRLDDQLTTVHNTCMQLVAESKPKHLF